MWQRYFKMDTVQTTEEYINCLMEHGYAEALHYDIALWEIIKKLRENYNYFE
jgi:hypothetical protein